MSPVFVNYVYYRLHLFHKIGQVLKYDKYDMLLHEFHLKEM